VRVCCAGAGGAVVRRHAPYRASPRGSARRHNLELLPTPRARPSLLLVAPPCRARPLDGSSGRRCADRRSSARPLARERALYPAALANPRQRSSTRPKDNMAKEAYALQDQTSRLNGGQLLIVVRPLLLPFSPPPFSSPADGSSSCSSSACKSPSSCPSSTRRPSRPPRQPSGATSAPRRASAGSARPSSSPTRRSRSSRRA